MLKINKDLKKFRLINFSDILHQFFYLILKQTLFIIFYTYYH